MSTRTSRDRFTELLFYAVVLLVAYLSLQVVWPFLEPLSWAAILSLTLRPVYMHVRIRLPRGRAALVTTLLAGVLIIGPAAFLGTVVARQVPVALKYITELSTATPERILQVWDVMRARVPLALPADPTELLAQGVQQAAAVLAPRAGSLLAQLFTTLGSLLVMLFALFFFLRDGRAFADLIRRLLPFAENESERLVAETGDLVVASVGAGLTVAAVQGLVGGLVFWILGLPAPAVWGAAIAICALLPVVGSTIVWVPVVIWLFLSGDVTRALALLLISGLILSSIDNVLRPWILSGRSTASGLVIFIGLLGGVSAFGFVGLVLGPIVLVVAGSLIDALTRRVHLSSDDVAVIE